MKNLKDTLNENLLLEKQTFAHTNYNEVVELAKANPSFTVVKSGWGGSSGKAFELKLGNLTLVVDFLNLFECLYMFVDDKKEALYSSPTTEAERVDWDKLFNQTLYWLADKKRDLQDGLRYSTQKMKTAEKKYRRSNKSDDFNTFNSMERQCMGIEKKIQKIDNLIKLYK